MFWSVTLALLEGLKASTQLFGFTLLFGLPLGLVVAFGSMSKWAPFRFLLRPKKPKKAVETAELTGADDLPAKPEEPSAFIKALATFRPIHVLTDVIVWVVRGTPLMLQLMIIYYGPGLWLGNTVWGSNGRMVASIVAFTVNYACYFSVIYRGGIQGVPVGQREAAQVLGLTRRQIFFKITLLQMIKRIVPPMSNEIITLVKDTSLAFAIGVAEMFSTAKALVASQRSMMPFAISALFYWGFNFLVEIILGRIEKKMDYYHD